MANEQSVEYTSEETKDEGAVQAPKKKKKSFLIIVIILIIIAFVATFFVIKAIFIKEKEGETSEPEETSALAVCEMMGGEIKNWCLGQVTRNKDYCDKAASFRNECLEDIAFLTKNLGLCKSEECKQKVATISKNPKICMGMENVSNSDACFSGVAVFSQNWEICHNIKDKRLKAKCLVIAGNNEQACKELEAATDRYQCMGALAVLNNSPAFCENAGHYKASCYQYVAAKMREGAVCDKIREIEDFINSEYYYSVCKALAEKDVSVCERMESLGFSNEECFLSLARQISESNPVIFIFGSIPVQ